MNLVVQCGKNGEKVNIEQISETTRQIAITDIFRGMKLIGFIPNLKPNSTEKTA